MDDKAMKTLLELACYPSALQVGKRPTPAEQTLFEIVANPWIAGFHELMREYDKDYPSPVKVRQRKIFRPKVDYLEMIYALCKECHASQRMVRDTLLPYPTAADWFKAILMEILWNEAQTIVDGGGVEVPAGMSKNPKRDSLSGEKEQVKLAKGLRNPYLGTQQVLMADLLSTAIALRRKAADKSRFSKVYKEFLVAWKKDIDAKGEKGYSLYRVKKGDVYEKGARGHEKKLRRQTLTGIGVQSLATYFPESMIVPAYIK